MMFERTLSFFLWAVVSFWSRTLRIHEANRKVHDRFAGEGRTVIYAFWHDSVFLLPHTHRDSGIMIMVSESRDGDVAARTLRHFGFEMVRGSSKRKGCRALIGLITGMRQGRFVAIAVDGPRGPRHEAKEGAVFLAGKMQVPIVPVATGVKRCWTLEKTWDRFIVPAPFTEGVVLYGEPIIVNGTSNEEIESRRSELEANLQSLTHDAAEYALSLRRGKRAVIKNESSPIRDQ
jgi:hypothetical protein